MSGKKKKSDPATKPAADTAFLAATSPPPDADGVRDELIVFWDAFSPLSAAGVRLAYDLGKSLDDIGIGEDDALTFINKYNSIILRGPGRGPLVKTSEARTWASEDMPVVVQTVTARAQP
jgi:hypothetical protein